MTENIGKLMTEQVNPRTVNIDTCSTIDKLNMINSEDMLVAMAVQEVIPAIAKVVDTISERFANGGRLFYVGAGTSGRIGVLDASECPPTYGTTPEMVQAIIAGGNSAIFVAAEGIEDSEELGRQAIIEHGIQANDSVIGIAASGRTPFVVAALKEAGDRGAFTVGLSNTTPCAFDSVCQKVIAVNVGPEAVTGSTRMKAGTAQKMVLNMISTCVMINLGKLYQNLMVDVKISNKKLFDRGVRIVQSVTGCSSDEASAVLKSSDGNVKAAILIQQNGIGCEKALRMLEESGGVLRVALEKTKV